MKIDEDGNDDPLAAGDSPIVYCDVCFEPIGPDDVTVQAQLKVPTADLRRHTPGRSVVCHVRCWQLLELGGNYRRTDPPT